MSDLRSTVMKYVAPGWRLYTAVALVSGFLLAAPDSMTAPFGAPFSDPDDRGALGLVFLLSAALAAVSALGGAFPFISGKAAEALRRRRFDRLNVREKSVFIYCLMNQTQGFKLPKSAPVASSLIDKGLAESAGEGTDKSWRYRIEDRAWQWANRHRAKVLASVPANDEEQRKTMKALSGADRAGF